MDIILKILIKNIKQNSLTLKIRRLKRKTFTNKIVETKCYLTSLKIVYILLAKPITAKI